jgi:hypothetical protein
MDLHLKVDADDAVGPDDDIRANANGGWYVAARVRDAAVRTVVGDPGRRLGDGRSHKALRERRRLRLGRDRGGGHEPDYRCECPHRREPSVVRRTTNETDRTNSIVGSVDP